MYIVLQINVSCNRVWFSPRNVISDMCKTRDVIERYVLALSLVFLNPMALFKYHPKRAKLRQKFLRIGVGDAD